MRAVSEQVSRRGGWSLWRAVTYLLRFAWIEAQSCVFAVALFAGIAVTSVVTLPIPRYDALLIYVVVLTLGFWVLRWETWREVLVIAGFHLIGLALEIYKVRAGSWTYPDQGWTKVAGVPLYSGFMYAAIGSYMCQAWRRFDLRVTGYPAVAITAVALGIYLNFYTHHFLPDARWALAVAMLLVLRRAWVHFTVGDRRFRLPLAVAFVLIGLFVWIAENAGTLLGAWRYPDQADGWTLVHASKFGSWSLLVTLSFVLVATVKATEGRLYGRPETTPTVVARQLTRRRRTWRDPSGPDAVWRAGRARPSRTRNRAPGSGARPRSSQRPVRGSARARPVCPGLRVPPGQRGGAAGWVR
jgi:uncharacterized membrane protein YoaT (DUF817 family)